jgi:hypothetical protein
VPWYRALGTRPGRTGGADPARSFGVGNPGRSARGVQPDDTDADVGEPALVEFVAQAVGF